MSATSTTSIFRQTAFILAVGASLTALSGLSAAAPQNASSVIKGHAEIKPVSDKPPTPQEAAAHQLEEEKKAAENAAAAEEKRKKMEEAKQKRIEAQKDAAAKKRERERSCVIKPVMTEAEIKNCKSVWR